MVVVRTYNDEWYCEADYCLAMATEKIAKMAADGIDRCHWWANVLDLHTGELLYQCWWRKGMLHTWCAETNEEDEMILFL